jgi:hypothetical protein
MQCGRYVFSNSIVLVTFFRLIEDPLRYLTTDDVRPLVAARRETSEVEYIALMRERFVPTLK